MFNRTFLWMVLVAFIAYCCYAAWNMTLITPTGWPTAPERGVFVLCAKQEYEQGTLVKDPESMFEVREFSKNELPRGSILEEHLNSLRDCVLTKSLEKGEPLTSEMFRPMKE